LPVWAEFAAIASHAVREMKTISMAGLVASRLCPDLRQLYAVPIIVLYPLSGAAMASWLHAVFFRVPG
jgi:hypothetical protein